jgi:hypothetical protein
VVRVVVDQEIGCDDALVAAENKVRSGMNGKCSCIHSYFAGILFTAPHNVHETRYPRVDDWNEVRRRFLA